jgi:predicted phosphodiesterase
VSGVHGNLAALQAVMEEIGRQERVERILCAGDVVGLGPHPNEVIDVLRDARADVVKGNYDDAVAFDRISSGVDFPDAESEQVDRRALAWTRRTLTADSMTYLRDLPFDVRLLDLGTRVEVRRNEDQELKEFRRTFVNRLVFGSLADRTPKSKTKRLLMVHGSSRALNELIRSDTANSILAAIAEHARADVVITGHADEGFTREHAGVLFIGVAGLSGPRTRPGQAGFMLIETRGGVRADWIPVSYDPSQHLRAIAESGLPPALTARFDLTSL